MCGRVEEGKEELRHNKNVAGTRGSLMTSGHSTSALVALAHTPPTAAEISTAYISRFRSSH